MLINMYHNKTVVNKRCIDESLKTEAESDQKPHLEGDIYCKVGRSSVSKGVYVPAWRKSAGS